MKKKRSFVPGQKGVPATWALAAPFVPVGVTNRDKRSSFVPVARPGTKGHPLLSRTGVSGWEIGTTGVSQPGQINVFVVVWVLKRSTNQMHTVSHHIRRFILLARRRAPFFLVFSDVEHFFEPGMHGPQRLKKKMHRLQR